jgi:hypothetical protein
MNTTTPQQGVQGELGGAIALRGLALPAPAPRSPMAKEASE